MLMTSWLKMLSSQIRSRRCRTETRSRFCRTIRQRATTNQLLSQRAETLEIRQVLSSTNWVAAGPFGVINGQMTNVNAPGENSVTAGKSENFVTGAVNVVLPHPSNPDVLFVGSVNGGVWRTMNARSEQPDWQPLTDFEASLSIGAMAFDAEDTEGKRLVVAIGRSSSFSFIGGEQTGLLVTENALAENPVFERRGIFDLIDTNLTGVTVAGSSIVVTANESGGGITPGIYYSNNDGIAFTKVPEFDEPAFDIIQDPDFSDRLYVGTQTGIYRSDDGGVNWDPVGGNLVDDG